MTCRPTLRLPALLLALGASACGDFRRVNPFDPGVPVTLSISGPDSAFSVGDTLRFSLVTNPPYPHEPPTWWLSNTHGSMEAFIDQSGLVRVTADRSFGGVLGATQDVTVHVRLGGGRVAEKKLIFIHRPVALCLLTCDRNKAFTLDSLNPSVNGPVGYVDARRNFVLPTPPATVVARTNGVVTIARDPNSWDTEIFIFGRKGVGSTWVVATAGAFSDSMLVTVTDTIPWHYPY